MHQSYCPNRKQFGQSGKGESGNPHNFAVHYASGPSEREHFGHPTLKERNEIIALREKGMTIPSLAQKYGKSISSIHRTLTKQSHYIHLVSSGHSTSRKSPRKVANEEEEAALAAWLDECVDNGDMVSGRLLIMKMKQLISKKTGQKPETVRVSPHWLDGWKDRYNVRQFGVHGERRSADLISALLFRPRLLSLMRKEFLPIEAVFNMDETGLFFRRVITKTLARKEAHKQMVMGTKQKGERMAIALCCNAKGHYLRPVVSWRSQNPRCCKGFPLQGDTSPFWYVKSTKAWFTTDAFRKWFEEEFVTCVRKYLVDLNLPPRAILLLDNAPTHLEMDCNGVSTVFLPANTTSIIQPLDHGLIRYFKAVYWQEAEARCLMETKFDAGNQGKWFAEMKPRVAFELITVALRKLKSAEGANVTEHCWTSALGVDEKMTEEQYNERLQKRIPGPKTIEELLKSPEAIKQLKKVEQMSMSWIKKHKKRALGDAAESSEEEEDPQTPTSRIPDDKLAQLELILRDFGSCSEVQELMKSSMAA
jgi:hypothetical protein